MGPADSCYPPFHDSTKPLLIFIRIKWVVLHCRELSRHAQIQKSAREMVKVVQESAKMSQCNCSIWEAMEENYY